MYIFITILISLSTALLSAYLTDRYAKKRAKSEQLSQLQATKLAIHAELQAVLNLYEPYKLSPNLPQSGDDIKVIRISSKYNTVYRNNADKLGLMERNVVESVVTAYTLMEAFIDTLSLLASRWESMVTAERSNADISLYRQDMLACYQVAYEQQTITLRAIRKAIQILKGED